MKNIEKLHFITHGEDVKSTCQQVDEALAGGVRWIQLRMKKASEKEVREAALYIKKECLRHDATCILNDRVEIAKDLELDGVHIGQDDMPVSEARKLLGAKAIIGATANNIEHCLKAFDAGANYIGLGPYRYTRTKEKLSPVLGLAGYHEIISAMKAEMKELPVVAIGGITLSDVKPVLSTGVRGIALSGAIIQAKNSERAAAEFIKELDDETVSHSR